MREQSYRDPVHDFITIREPLFLKLVDTPEVQRLRRIRQLGSAYGTYHGAEHTRFGHALGALWIMTLVMERLRSVGVDLDDEVVTIARAAALLHDLGHGPFSHALEGHLTPGDDHEVWTRRILLGDTEVNRVLSEHSASLPAQIASVIDGAFSGPPFVMGLVSSQLDVDRMDYLLRDSHYTGVTYGRFDLERVINTLQVHDGAIVSQIKGVVAIEEYLLARYLMYWQVYLHKTIRSQEALLTRMWRRAVDLLAGQADPIRSSGASGGATREEVLADIPPPLAKLLLTTKSGSSDVVALDTFLAIDDYDIVSAAKVWRLSRDPILSDLAGRFLDRNLFKAVYRHLPPSISQDALQEAADFVQAQGFDPRYYLVVDDVLTSAYDLYVPQDDDILADGVQEPLPLMEDFASSGPSAEARRKSAERRKKPILIWDGHGAPQEITRISRTMRALAHAPRTAVNVFAPAAVIEEVKHILTA